MPLTAKEKMRAYRERIQQNKEKEAEVKKKDRDRKIVKKSKMTPDELSIEKVKNRHRVAQHRAKKKSNSPSHAGCHRVPGQIQTGNLIHFPAHTPQSVGKAKRRVTVLLPTSPRKRKAVVEALANEEGLPVKKAQTDNGNRGIDSETEQKVVDFYLNMSWMCPGKKDYFIIRGPGKQKKTVQKQYMLTTLKEAHAMYLEAHPDNSLSFSKFASLRPPQVQVQGQIPHNSCLCKYHENIRLLLMALHKVFPQIPVDFRSFITMVVCNQEDENCMTGHCDNCPGIDHFAPPADIARQHVSWQQWSSPEGRVRLQREEGTAQDCFDALSKKIPHFLEHTFVKRVQAAEFTVERESVQEEPDKVVIQIDFAENFTAKNQNEIQSAYWAHNQVTLFTVCAWEKNGIHSCVIASDHLNHDKYAVNFFVKKILRWLEEKVGTFKEAVIFSDGAAQQFKQRYLLCSITLLHQKIIWNFFATSHGKGPVDGIGGTVKRAVATEVMSGKAEVRSSKEFADVARAKCPNITILHVETDDIFQSMADFDKNVQDVTAIPNTKQMHKFTVLHPYVIAVQKHAKSASSINHCFREEGSNTNDPTMEDGAQNEDDSEREGGDNIETNVSINNKTSEENIMEVKLDWKWVEVQYPAVKSAKKFKGQVINTTEDQVTVKFLKMSFGKYIWPEVDDIDIVLRSNIVAVLSEPQMDRRGILTFKEN